MHDPETQLELMLRESYKIDRFRRRFWSTLAFVAVVSLAMIAYRMIRL